MAASGGGGGSDGGESAAIVTELLIPPRLEPDRIPIELKVESRAAGKLEFLIQFQRVEGGDQGRSAGNGAAQAASPTADALPLEPVEGVRAARFVFRWDSKRDLEDASAEVRVIVTPIKDGTPGEPFRSQPFLAGNTPVAVREPVITSRGDFVLITLDVADLESDSALMVKVEMAVEGGDFHALPLAALGLAGKRFTTGPDGAQGSFSFLAAALDRDEVHQEARQVGRPGFRGEIKVKVFLRDFQDEDLSANTGAFLLDNNDPPSRVEILPLGAVEAASGIVPIRYRIFDRDLNPADISVEIDLNDGLGFLPANELASFPSEGRSGLCTLDPLDVSKAGGCTMPQEAHAFLWDAASQVGGQEKASVRVTASDREPGASAQIQDLTGFSRSGLKKRGDLATGTGPAAALCGDFDGDGFLDLVVANKTGNTCTFFPGGETGLPQAGKEVPCGRAPSDLIAGDFDADGVLDLVAANPDALSITYLRGGPGGLPDGPGPRSREISVSGRTVDFAVGDFEGDRFLDLAVATGSAALILVRGAGGQEALEARSEIPLESRPSVLASGDFAVDEAADLLLADEAGQLLWIPGFKGTGLSWEDRKPVGPPSPVSPKAISAGDFDGDAFLDAAVLDVTAQVILYLRGGAAGLSPVDSTGLGVGLAPQALLSADLDGDGAPDLAVTNRDSGDVTYLRGGRGGFSEERMQTVKARVRPVSLAAGDFDGDGFQDLAVANEGSASVTPARGGRDALRPLGDLQVVPFPRVLASGDFDGDGLLDLVALSGNSNSRVASYLAGSAGGLEVSGESAAGTLPVSAAAGDFDGDGLLEAVVSNSGSDNVTYLENDGGALVRARDIPAGKSPGAITAGDFDGDGISEAVVANEGADSIIYLRVGPAGLAQFGQPIKTGAGPLALLIGDFDGDGHLDLAVANGDGGNLTYIRGESPGGLAGVRARTVPAGGLPRALAGGDFDLDGSLDLVAANGRSGTLTFYRGGAGGLSGDPGRVAEIAAGPGPLALAAGDFDGDGVLDAAVALLAGSVVCFSGGAGGVSPDRRVEARVGERPRALSVADHDGDGFPDLIVANGDSASVTWLRGGANGFSEDPGRRSDLAVGLSPIALAAGEFDGDGFADVLVASSEADSVSFFRGGAAGLSRGGVLAAGTAPRALLRGAFGGLGLDDALVVNSVSGTVGLFRQRYLIPHATLLVETAGPPPPPLVDPRNPARYRLELPGSAFSDSTQVTVIPGSAELWQGLSSGGKSFRPLSDPVSILPEGAAPQGGAWLLLRLREPSALAPSPRVFHRASTMAAVGALDLPVEVVEFEKGTAARFRISNFGSYLVASERGN